MTARSLNALAATAPPSSHLSRQTIHPGDLVILLTVRSEYRLRALEGGLFEASGGWFDRHTRGPSIVGVTGASWGGSAIMPGVLAACGLRVEFSNRLITSPVRTIVVLSASRMN